MPTATQAQIDTAIRFHLRAAKANEEAGSALWTERSKREAAVATETALSSDLAWLHEFPELDRLHDHCQWAVDGGMHASAALSHLEAASFLAMQE